MGVQDTGKVLMMSFFTRGLLVMYLSMSHSMNFNHCSWPPLGVALSEESDQLTNQFIQENSFDFQHCENILHHSGTTGSVCSSLNVFIG